MKLEIKGTFENRTEMESKKERIKKLLLDCGEFTNVKAYEDLITGEYTFYCETTRVD